LPRLSTSSSFPRCQDETIRNDLAYCLSFAVDDADFSRNLPQLFDDPRVQRQLEISRNQLVWKRTGAGADRSSSKDHGAPLPRTVRDALRPTRRATVITETTAPFRIVDVNSAWEDLCGYTFVESKGRTLGSLLRGPDTDPVAATALIAKLVQGEEAGTTLVNYTKAGRRFRNRIRVGPLYDDDSDHDAVVGGGGYSAIRNDASYYGGGPVKYFVGVLQEVHGP
jgi:PAS domain S-box-containing protein